MNMRHWAGGCVAAIMLVFALSAATFTQAAVVQGMTRAKGAPLPHVYLLRGLLNMFSLGMDRLGDKIEQRGIHATVTSYTSWPELAEEAIANCKSGRQDAIILIGHSAGAISAMKMADQLNHAGVSVALVVTFDPLFPPKAPGTSSSWSTSIFRTGWATRWSRDRRSTARCAMWI